MALSQSPSAVPEIQEKTNLSNEAQERVNIVANAAIAVLNTNLDVQKAVKNLFGRMVTENLRSPENIAKIQDGLYEARDARLAEANSNDRLSILKSFSAFMQNFTQWIAQMNRDVPLSNEANILKNESDTKIAQVKSTYHQILENNLPATA